MSELSTRLHLRRKELGLSQEMCIRDSVTIAGDICAAIHNVAACRKRHFAGIINVQAAVHSHTFEMCIRDSRYQ